MESTESIQQFVIQFGWTEAVIISALFGAIQFFSAKWIERRLQYSIKHEYDKLLADFSYKRRKDQKEYIADIWALSLWLPPPLVRHLTEFLVGKDSNFYDTKDLLIKMRKELRGKDDDLEPERIAHIDSQSDIMNKRNLDKYISEQSILENGV